MSSSTARLQVRRTVFVGHAEVSDCCYEILSCNISTTTLLGFHVFAPSRIFKQAALDALTASALAAAMRATLAEKCRQVAMGEHVRLRGVLD